MKENVFKRRPYTQSKLKESIIERAVQSFGDLLQQCVAVKRSPTSEYYFQNLVIISTSYTDWTYFCVIIEGILKYFFLVPFTRINSSVSNATTFTFNN